MCFKIMSVLALWQDTIFSVEIQHVISGEIEIAAACPDRLCGSKSF